MPKLNKEEVKKVKNQAGIYKIRNSQENPFMLDPLKS